MEVIQQNWPQVQAGLTVTAGTRVVTATSAFCTTGDRKQVEDFFTTHKVASSERTCKPRSKSIDACIAPRAGEQKNLTKWLSTQASR